MAPRYLNPGNDVSFKKLFGTSDHKPLLISFLNAILELEGTRKIKEVELLPQEQSPLLRDLKKSILDVKCTDERNIQYIVEMQNNNVPDFAKRAQFYLADSYVMQASSGSKYVELKPVILLAIANYDLFPEKERVVSYHKTLDVETLERDLKDMSYVFVELPKFIKKDLELKTDQDKWLYFFRNWEKSTEIPSAIKEPEIIEAYHSMEEFNWSEEEREAYVKANIAAVDEYRRIEESRKEGRKEERIALVKKLLKRNRSAEEISEDIGLSLEEVQNLAQGK
ncbi:MAG: Rpn family recombination-promoting nuclease/putative transposase [Chlamydiota bacterium]